MFSEDKKRSVHLRISELQLKLEQCELPHNFVACVPDEDFTLFKQKCTKCGGMVFESDAAWYKKGLEHGRR